MKSQVVFCGTLYDVRAKRDGGGRVQLDFGRDAFEEVIEMMRFFKENAVSVAICLAPYKDRQVDINQIDIEEYLKVTSQEPNQDPAPSPTPQKPS
jgi:hypothetical protein